MPSKVSAICPYKLSYAAGYFDGEGCIWVYQIGPLKVFQLRVSIVSGDKDTIDLFSEIFGGNVNPVKCKSSKINLYRWYRNGAHAHLFLSLVSPFMIAKRDQAELVLNSGWIFGRHTNQYMPVPPDQIQKRTSLQQSLRLAKQKGRK